MKKSRNLPKMLVETKPIMMMMKKKSREQGKKLKVSITSISAFKMSEKIEKLKSTNPLLILLRKSEKSKHVSKYSKKNIREINHLHQSCINSSMMQSMSSISLGSFVSGINSI